MQKIRAAIVGCGSISDIYMTNITSGKFQILELVGCSVNADAKALGVREIGGEWIRAYREHGGTGNYTAHMHNLVLLTDGGVPIAPFKRILVRLKAPDTSGDL